jgi:hypothetical protein
MRYIIMRTWDFCNEITRVIHVLHVVCTTLRKLKWAAALQVQSSTNDIYHCDELLQHTRIIPASGVQQTRSGLP